MGIVGYGLVGGGVGIPDKKTHKIGLLLLDSA